MEMEAQMRSKILADLPPEWPDDPLPAIRAYLEQANEKLVVVDDDPTGSQTVYDIPVLTGWGIEALKAELENDLPAFYLLTNTRSMPLEQAYAINAEIGRNLRDASLRTGRRAVLVSRGDSTLRGHFPGEMEALAEGLRETFDAWLLIPALLEEGRFTANDIHYVSEGDQLTPIGESAYARDSSFGFRSSNLREWVAEKTEGKVPADQVASISLEDIRLGGPEQVQERLLDLAPGSICVVNAASRRDLEVFTQGLLAAEQAGRRYLYRSGPSLIPVRIGLGSYPLLTCSQVPPMRTTGGLILVGSYMPNTNRQIEYLEWRRLATSITVEVERLLDPDQREIEIRRVAEQASQEMGRGRDTLIYTSRKLLTGQNAGQSLEIVRQVSASLIAILNAITIRPRYILAKGGITSSDVATRGLGVRRAMVLGQISPGVSLWQLGPESRYDGLVYIVFPGNIGEPETLADVVEILQS